jgi:murein L,D-transpeptidase YcbB/YkuD
VAAGRARVRQEPGPWNALGAAKFMFPNEFMVYLHGTDHPGLFARADRALSNGCVRVPDPALLAEFVLAGQPGWDAERIARALEAEEPTTVRLERRPWVFIVYGTAYADREGTVHFFRDPYGHDARLDEALRRRPTRS